MNGQKLLSKISKKTGLPEDLLMDLPCLRMEGFDRFAVENHKGISVFTATLIKLRTSSGAITLTGKNLVLEGIGNEGLIVRGEIETIELRRV